MATTVALFVLLFVVFTALVDAEICIGKPDGAICADGTDDCRVTPGVCWNDACMHCANFESNLGSIDWSRCCPVVPQWLPCAGVGSTCQCQSGRIRYGRKPGEAPFAAAGPEYIEIEGTNTLRCHLAQFAAYGAAYADRECDCWAECVEAAKFVRDGFACNNFTGICTNGACTEVDCVEHDESKCIDDGNDCKYSSEPAEHEPHACKDGYRLVSALEYEERTGARDKKVKNAVRTTSRYKCSVGKCSDGDTPELAPQMLAKRALTGKDTKRSLSGKSSKRAKKRRKRRKSAKSGTRRKRKRRNRRKKGMQQCLPCEICSLQEENGTENGTSRRLTHNSTDGSEPCPLWEQFLQYLYYFIDNPFPTKMGKKGKLTEMRTVVINEVIADPRRGNQEFVEVYNVGSSEVDLSDWTMKDKAGYNGLWSSRSLPGHSFVGVTFKSKLNNGGDTLKLIDASGRVVDIFKYTYSVDGMSWARVPDGGDWSTTPQEPSRGATNGAAPVVINEVIPDPRSGNQEFVEVYNVGGSDVDLTGWTLKDKAGYKGSWSSSMLLGHSFVGVSFSSKLNNGGDTLELRDNTGRLVDIYTYTYSVDGRSWARVPDGGDWSATPQEPSRGSTNGVAPTSPLLSSSSVSPPCGGSCDDGICFGSWNIQNFGTSKASRPAVMAAIRSVLARYDLSAIQEVSQMPRPPYVCGENTETAICASNPDSESFALSVSPRIGDEQYAILARKATIKVSDVHQTYPDPAGIHSRPPHAFDMVITKNTSEWRLVVATTHTDPDHAEQEILNFPNVLEWMESAFNASHVNVHIALAGDFNADGSYFKDHNIWQDSKLNLEFAGYKLLTSNDLDTTVAVSSNAYDRIVVDAKLASSSDIAAVFRLEEVDLSAVFTEGCQMGYVSAAVCNHNSVGLPWDEIPLDVKTNLAKELSDHHPVEACLRV